ncbi:MAG TPA: hypothetical protein PLH57_08035, partial [Oligoflexia bacterium]|nr:hypothetical protein [Oligoflexia bacterium]
RRHTPVRPALPVQRVLPHYLQPSLIRDRLSGRVFRCERTPEYWAELEKIRTCTRLQWLNEQGEATAYLAYNRGKDLKGVVHEWGGEGNALTKLAAVAASKNSDLTWLTHPGLADPIMGLAENRTSLKPLMQSHLALFKPLTSRVIDYSKFWFWGLDSL